MTSSTRMVVATIATTKAVSICHHKMKTTANIPQDYWLPNDEPEIHRLNQQHHCFTLLKGGRLHLAPLPSTPFRILDVGTGTGIWCIQMAEQYPTAEIIGIDISPIQPEK